MTGTRIIRTLGFTILILSSQIIDKKQLTKNGREIRNISYYKILLDNRCPLLILKMKSFKIL
jgi:hypothetical protein